MPPSSAAAGSTSRAIARAAVRAELSVAAYELIVEKGFDNVTLDDLAEAGGVSRSTFLRHVGSKDQVIHIALENYAERLADALRARPSTEDNWTALQRAIESFVTPIYARDRTGALALTRLIQHTPALYGGGPSDWRRPLAHALAERSGVSDRMPIAVAVEAAAAMDCMGVAIAYWAAADGEADLLDLLEESFAALRS